MEYDHHKSDTKEMSNMVEQWTRWEPIKGLAAKYDIESIYEDPKKLKIVLSDADNTQQKIHMIFDGSAYAYRSTDESFRGSIVHELKKEHGTDFYAQWTFFKVANSSYVQWLSEQSDTWSDCFSFMHFSILAIDSVVDIAAVAEPKIELIVQE